MSELESNNDELKKYRLKKRRGFFNLPPWLDFTIDLLKIAAIAFIIVWPIHHFIFQPFYVVGPSMEPNFYDKDYLIIEEISYRFNQPKRGEVVIFRSTSSANDHLIKRVIGLPEERILVKSGKIYIYNDHFPNGLELDESEYLAPGITTRGRVDVNLIEDEYYVLGDHRNVSLDSRVFGSIKRDSIVGRAWWRGWPIKNLGLIRIPVFAH